MRLGQARKRVITAARTLETQLNKLGVQLKSLEPALESSRRESYTDPGQEARDRISGARPYREIILRLAFARSEQLPPELAMMIGGHSLSGTTAVVTVQHPLKATGQSGGKIRSRLECEGGLVLQSGRTLAENREIAGEVAPSWSKAPPAGEEVVRRYDRAPPLVRDARVEFSSGRPDALSPAPFDALLRSIVDAAGDSPPGA